MKLSELIQMLGELDPDLNVYMLHDEAGLYDASGIEVLNLHRYVRTGDFAMERLYDDLDLKHNRHNATNPLWLEGVLTAEQGVLLT